jgi:hypothetical protein
VCLEGEIRAACLTTQVGTEKCQAQESLEFSFAEGKQIPNNMLWLVLNTRKPPAGFWNCEGPTIEVSDDKRMAEIKFCAPTENHFVLRRLRCGSIAS